MTIKMMLGRGIAVLCVTGAVSLAAVGSAPSVADAKDELLAPDAGTVLRAASVPRLAQAGTEVPLRKSAKTKSPEIEALEKAGAPEDVKRSVPASRKARFDRCNQIPECKARLDAAKKALGRKSMLSPERGAQFSWNFEIPCRLYDGL